jgi:DNA replication and repair protein RecF
MGFKLTELHLKGFRNHTSFDLDSISENTIFVGANATGKSSLLEAVQLLSMLESFRTTKWSSLVNNELADCQLFGRFEQGDRLHEVQMNVVEGKREYLFNGKGRRLGDMAKIVPAIIFTPDDLSLVKGASEQRRTMIDSLGKRLSAQYSQVMADYTKTMRQRNSILRERQKSRLFDAPPSSEELVWTDRLAELGARLTVYRHRLYLRLIAEAAKHYHDLSGGETLSAEYLFSFISYDAGSKPETVEFTVEVEVVQALMAEALEQRRIDEYIRGLSLVGSHRDEILFYVDGRDARSFASQGQQRSIALAIKLAEMDLISEIIGEDAILLLDDVMSELDASRREQLLVLCSKASQCFITTTDINSIPEGPFKQATVIELFHADSAAGNDVEGTGA